NIKKAIDNRADDAIRAAAKQKDMKDIDSDKVGFADTVSNMIQDDLRKVGLTLNNIAISEIEESDTYNENDYFDAQGVRLRTETIQRSIQQKTEVELATRVAIEDKELAAEKQSLAISQEKQNANLTQQKEVEFLRAQQEREIQETKDKEAAKIEQNRILQEQNVEEDKIQQKLAVQQKQIAADIALEEQNKQYKVAQTLQQQEAEVAEITRQKTLEEEKIQQQLAIQQKQIEANIALEEQNKQLKVAQALQQQESEVAEVTRKKTIQASNLLAKAEVAAAQQESEIAQQKAAIAIANKEKERLEAEAEKAEAESAVITAKEVEAAERDRQLSLIVAEREAQEKRIADQNVVEIDVFRRRRQAEIARQAAELEAESIRTLADANRYKDLAEAEGKRALIQSENSLSTANRTADIIKEIWPELAPQLPSILQALAPQPGVLGDARIYSFPGLNGQNGNGASSGDISKLLLSTSGITLLNSLLDEGKLGNVVSQVKNLLSTENTVANVPNLSQPVTSNSETDNPNPPITDTQIEEFDEILQRFKQDQDDVG
ncbi:MAG: flotillin domain-containing protein, partial [Microcystaceae cyanobacterium]